MDSKIFEVSNIKCDKNISDNNKTEKDIIEKLNKTIYGNTIQN